MTDKPKPRVPKNVVKNAPKTKSKRRPAAKVPNILGYSNANPRVNTIRNTPFDIDAMRKLRETLSNDEDFKEK